MLDRNTLATLLMAGSVLFAPAIIRAGDSHPDTPALSLNHGQKWASDAPLRQGMTRIRTAIAEVWSDVNNGVLPAKGYEKLAASVEGHVNYMIENCKLPEDADAQLHILLERILEGAARMRTSADRKHGVAEVVQALKAYGMYFEHEGWELLPR